MKYEKNFLAIKLKSVLKHLKPIFLHEPDIDLNDIKAVSLALKQKKISSHASITLDFEKGLKNFTNSITLFPQLILPRLFI